jgi:uncharacterized protein (TIGR03435 family)
MRAAGAGENQTEDSSVKWFIFSLLAVASIAVGQERRFEAVAIRPAKDVNGNYGWSWKGRRFTANAIYIKSLIAWAYDLKEFQLEGGPKWMANDRFNITAAAEGEKEPSDPEFKRMVQIMLIERFQLKIHPETKEMSSYVLREMPGGVKLKAARESTSGNISMRRGHLEFSGVTLDAIAQSLAGALDRPVVDETGLASRFDGTLDWAPEGDDGPSIFTAVTEQMGLKLESRRGPVEMLVIERLERPDEN